MQHFLSYQEIQYLIFFPTDTLSPQNMLWDLHIHSLQALELTAKELSVAQETKLMTSVLQIYRQVGLPQKTAFYKILYHLQSSLLLPMSLGKLGKNREILNPVLLLSSFFYKANFSFQFKASVKCKVCRCRNLSVCEIPLAYLCLFIPTEKEAFHTKPEKHSVITSCTLRNHQLELPGQKLMQTKFHLKMRKNFSIVQ